MGCVFLRVCVSVCVKRAMCLCTYFIGMFHVCLHVVGRCSGHVSVLTEPEQRTDIGLLCLTASLPLHAWPVCCWTSLPHCLCGPGLHGVPEVNTILETSESGLSDQPQIDFFPQHQTGDPTMFFFLSDAEHNGLNISQYSLQ